MTAHTATAVQAIHGEVSANEFHRRSVAALHAAEVPFLIGGAYMVEVCGGVSRSTKDFDLYVRPDHMKAALRALARAGYKTELTFPHWLAKATYEGDIVDLIFRAGNGLCEVDDSWFDRARDDELLGVARKPAEDTGLYSGGVPLGGGGSAGDGIAGAAMSFVFASSSSFFSSG
jgi:hypothetical protein